MTEQEDARHLLERAERAATAGDLESAHALLRDAARIQELQLGPHDPALAKTLNNLAIIAERAGSSNEAETLYRRAVAITAAALPSNHPMTVASRLNLEDFCRARDLSIDAPAVTTPAWAFELENPFKSEREEADQIAVRPGKPDIAAKRVQSPSAAPRPNGAGPATFAPEPIQEKRSRSVQAVAVGGVVLVVAALVFWRPWSSRDASSAAPPQPAAPQAAETVAPQIPAPATRPVPIESTVPASVPPRDDRNIPADKAPAVGDVAVAAQICRTLSTGGSNWRCDAAGDPTAAGPVVFYTRVKSPRDTSVVHRWYQGATLRRSVTLAIRANAIEGYRTYSRLTVSEGDWRLEVRSADGSLLLEQRFAVR